MLNIIVLRITLKTEKMFYFIKIVQMYIYVDSLVLFCIRVEYAQIK